MSTPAPQTSRQPKPFLLNLYAILLEAGGPLLELLLELELELELELLDPPEHEPWEIHGWPLPGR